MTTDHSYGCLGDLDSVKPAGFTGRNVEKEINRPINIQILQIREPFRLFINPHTQHNEIRDVGQRGPRISVMYGAGLHNRPDQWPLHNARCYTSTPVVGGCAGTVDDATKGQLGVSVCIRGKLVYSVVRPDSNKTSKGAAMSTFLLGTCDPNITANSRLISKWCLLWFALCR